MGRLSDFIDKETEKRNRRTDEKLQPFMQQMDLLIKTKEKQEVKEQTDTYYTGKFKDVGVTYNPKSLNPEADLKIAMEESEYISDAVAKGWVTDVELQKLNRKEQLTLIKSKEEPETETYTSGGYRITTKWDGKTKKRVVVSKTKIDTKETTKTGESGTFYNRKTGEKFTVTIKDGVAKTLAGKVIDINELTETSPKTTTGKESTKYTDKLIDTGALSSLEQILGNELTEEQAKTLYSRIQQSKMEYHGVAGNVKERNPAEQFKIAVESIGYFDITTDFDEKIKSSEELLKKEKKKRGGALFSPSKKGTPDEDLITSLKKKIKSLKYVKGLFKGFGGKEIEEMKSGKKKVIIKDTDTVTMKGVKYTLSEIGKMMKEVDDSVTDEEVETKFRTLME